MHNTHKRASKGETLVETLVAIVIITFSAIILINMTIASTNINRKVESSDTNFREELAAAEGLQNPAKGQITVKSKSETGASKSYKYTVEYYGKEDGLRSYRIPAEVTNNG